MGKIKEWIFATDIDAPGNEEEGVVVDTEPKTSLYEQPLSARTTETVKKLSVNNDSQLVLFEPRAFKEAQEIGKYLKMRKAAVVNLHRLQKEQSKRVVDFLTGVIFAIDGDIQKIGDKIFLCTPKNIGVDGKITLTDDDDENEAQ